jgi:putative hydrolase of the HAD superfamily
MIRAVVFDFFGTLTPTVLAMATEQERASIGRLLGVDMAEMEHAWQAAYDERATGRVGGIRDMMAFLCDQLGATPSEADLDKAAEIRLTAYRRTTTVRTDAVDVLTALHAESLRIGVVSDCSVDLVRLWPSLPVAPLVDVPVFSAVVGKRKPDPLLFQTVCDGLNVTAAECLYVGDGGSNELSGASGFGMRAVLLADENWAFGHRYQGENEWPGERINALADVIGLVRRAA